MTHFDIKLLTLLNPKIRLYWFEMGGKNKQNIIHTICFVCFGDVMKKKAIKINNWLCSFSIYTIYESFGFFWSYQNMGEFRRSGAVLVHIFLSLCFTNLHWQITCPPPPLCPPSTAPPHSCTLPGSLPKVHVQIYFNIILKSTLKRHQQYFLLKTVFIFDLRLVLKNLFSDRDVLGGWGNKQNLLFFFSSQVPDSFQCKTWFTKVSTWVR